ncbi:MAG: threonine--tRNA ligase [Nitrospinaceae bacterium]|nr:threonine--tRNA ligase [Nitrospinaceae bacterium]NIR56789.1 threonine--tRNA ligase [Nitrospinaceae bacterium]NIS87245.1 threonine--tRNA ligase [Nitrospinaceae bacterium]NIT82399.1 threonine--tRNA ligase [Nitrospinaceae bacterium]NIU44612.1 threonine--tRNA ligase [Nitrospinaceae bacterium]
MSQNDKKTYDLETLRHSCAHLMAQAVKQLYPDTKITIGPVIEDGFFYDFHRDEPFKPEDLEKIEHRMHQIAKEGLPIKRVELSPEAAKTMFNAMGEHFKVEIIEDFAEGEIISAYTQGEFTDLCRGPHVENTKDLKIFKLLSTSAAYWRGDERNPVLQRIYGTAWHDKKELKAYLNRLEEAKKRDHRKLGKELDLYTVSDDVGPGLILWHPKGARIRYLMEEFWKQEHYNNGYELVYTPHAAKIDLWKISGHMEFYRENIFSPMEIEGKEYIMKPMNCPFHIQIYKTRLRSYRDLPLRWAELGTVYRYERSGVVHGLLRVRGFTQDDAHLFCRQDQLEEEVAQVIKFVLYILRSFGFWDFQVYLSTRPEKSVGSDEDWQAATSALAGALKKAELAYEEDPGEGVFYGPKIDIKIKDSLHRFWQVSTIQVDFNLPERFEMSYIGEDGEKHRPIMIHRALMGSLERFFGCLIEHYAGAFPVWLAPVQVILLPITDNHFPYTEELATRMEEAGIRVEKDLRNEKIGFKIREAQLSKIPYMLVLGDQEVQNKTVAVRKRKSKETRTMGVDEFLREVNGLIDTKEVDSD